MLPLLVMTIKLIIVIIATPETRFSSKVGEKPASPISDLVAVSLCEKEKGLMTSALSEYISSAFENRFARPPHAGKTGKRVKFPRCRATVSEEAAPGHWIFPGRPEAKPNEE